jgi:FkbM family methyltransferase
MRLLCVRGHHIWPAPLNGDSVIVDAGAHRGEFSAEIIKRFGSQCHLIEANPALAKQLSVPGAVSITEAALSARDGFADLHLAENPESSSLPSKGAAPLATATVEVETITLATLMDRQGLKRIDLLKLDIEGAEFDLIDATPDDVLCRIDQLTVEFHDFQPRFRGRHLFEQAHRRLERLGFVGAVMSFRTHGDVLFLNRESLDIFAASALYLRSVAKVVEKLRDRLRPTL